jgi:pyruvate,water dikinase
LRTFRLGEWLGDPITPLFETWLLKRMEARLFQRFNDLAPARVHSPFHVTVNGWYFTTVNFVPRNVPQALWMMVRHLLPALILRPRRLSVLSTRFAHVGMALFEDEWRKTTRDRYLEAVKNAHETLAQASAQTLTALIDTLADLAGDEIFYFFTVGGSAWKVEARLAAFYAKHLMPKIGGSHQDLLQGLASTGAESSHVVVSLDWFHPTLGELGEQTTGADTNRPAEAAARREAAEARAREQLRSSPALLERFELLLRRAQHFGRVREEQARHLTLAWPVLRRAVAQLSTFVKGSGLALRSENDVYFFTRDELLSQIDGAADPRLVDVAEARRATWNKQRRLDAPVVVGKMGLIQRRLFQGNGDLAAASAGAVALLQGAPASPGRATGRARIIFDVDEFVTLQAGEVLVAPATNPGWTPLFGRAAAVVTDTGSAMAHASLVAREYGIPAVVGTGNATKQLRSGDLVIVDGNRGTVERAL